MARGMTEVLFGAVPGKADASVAVSATSIEAIDIPQAWVIYRPTTASGSADIGAHTADGLTYGNWSIGWSY